MSDQYTRSRSKLKRRLEKKQSAKGLIMPRDITEKPTMTAFDRFMKKIYLSARKVRKIMPKDLEAYAGPAVIILLALLVLFGGIWAFTNKNAFAVYLGDTQMGVIAKSKKITAEELQSTAEKKLSSELGANVKVEEGISLTPIHASKKNIISVDNVIGKIYRNFTYQIEASIIKVEGVEMVSMKNDEEAQKLLDGLLSEYDQEDLNIVKKDFVEEVEIVKKYIDPSEVMTQEVAHNKLSSNVDSSRAYMVQEGDTLSKIASSQNLSVEALLSMNPTININSVLDIGQELAIVVPKPVLSVRTAAEIKYPDIKKKPVEIRENPSKPRSYQKVIKQGTDGQMEVVAYIIRVNGFETGEREIIKETTTTEPVAEVIEVGTKDE